jgi:hypothetical protein
MAYCRRDVIPVEQHLHSVLDAAPWIALGFIVFHAGDSANDWTLQWREQPLPVLTWIEVLLPAVIFCLLPALLEFGEVLRAKRVTQS